MKDSKYILRLLIPEIFFRIAGNLVEDSFEITPLMSTYLVAFIVSDFKALSLNDDHHLYRIWVKGEAITQAGYSMTVSPGIIEFMENFTSINYKFPKLDQAAVPDFAAGAMENWGLVTYRLVLATRTYTYLYSCCLVIC
jgi:aminopeptidase N